MDENQIKDLVKETRAILEKEPSWEPPKVITKFVKEKIKRARLNGLDWKKAQELCHTITGRPRYRQDDFGYVAELISLEHILYVEHYSKGSHGMGIGWGWGMKYLSNKYPKERLAILDEICRNPKHHHREDYKNAKLEEARKKREARMTDKQSERNFMKWWDETGGNG